MTDSVQDLTPEQVQWASDALKWAKEDPIFFVGVLIALGIADAPDSQGVPPGATIQ